jgi:hypothetical protein
VSVCVFVCGCVCVCVFVCVFVCMFVCSIDYIVNLKNPLVKTISPISIKLGRIDSWMKGFQSCSKKFIPCRNLVAMATKRNYKNKLKNILVKT